MRRTLALITLVLGTWLLLPAWAQTPGWFSRVNIGSTTGTSCTLTRGAGSPESAVTGDVCDVYLRTDGGAGTAIYVKESGTATNTGWKAVNAATSLTGTVAAARLPSVNLGTTSVDLTRASAALSLADISITGTGTYNAGAVTSSGTVRATTGYVVGTADTNGVLLGLGGNGLTMREGDDSAYVPLFAGAVTSFGAVTGTAFIPTGGAGTGPRISLASNTLIFNSGTSGFQFANQANDAARLTISDAGNLVATAASGIGATITTTAAGNYAALVRNLSATGVGLYIGTPSGGVPLYIYSEVAGAPDTGLLSVSGAGLLTVSGFGDHAFTTGGTGSNSLEVRNTTDGTTMRAVYWLGNSTASKRFAFIGNAASYTTSGPFVADAAVLYSNGVGGLSLSANDASGAIRFYSGGTGERWRMETTGGFYYPSATGGDKGLGTINASAVYDDNVLLTDWVFDLFYDGFSRDPIPDGGRLYDLADTTRATRVDRKLPWMPTRATFEQDRSLGKMVTRLWFGQEQQQIYIQQLADRVAALEAGVH